MFAEMIMVVGEIPIELDVGGIGLTADIVVFSVVTRLFVYA